MAWYNQSEQGQSMAFNAAGRLYLLYNNFAINSLCIFLSRSLWVASNTPLMCSYLYLNFRLNRNRLQVATANSQFSFAFRPLGKQEAASIYVREARIQIRVGGKRAGGCQCYSHLPIRPDTHGNLLILRTSSHIPCSFMFEMVLCCRYVIVKFF